MLKLIKLAHTSIFDQLKLEEYLLRDRSENYCIINSGSSPAIVMGISGNPDLLVHCDKAQELSIPLIKRFSGGGTVVVDEDTIFITFIFNAASINTPCFPEPIHRFCEAIYKQVFADFPFELKQNDYIFNNKKIGGNAQYIKKDRWLHHTSFLWKFNPKFMALLKHPPKMPAYRQNRSHSDFISTLSEHLVSKEQFIDKVIAALKTSFATDTITLNHTFEASRSSTHYAELVPTE